jgi:hypothetical protein
MALIEGRNQGKGAAKVTRRITLPEKTFSKAELYMKFINDTDFSYLVEQSLEFIFRRDKDFKKYSQESQIEDTNQVVDGKEDKADESHAGED